MIYAFDPKIPHGIVLKIKISTILDWVKSRQFVNQHSPLVLV